MITVKLLRMIWSEINILPPTNCRWAKGNIYLNAINKELVKVIWTKTTIAIGCQTSILHATLQHPMLLITINRTEVAQ